MESYKILKILQPNTYSPNSTLKKLVLFK